MVEQYFPILLFILIGIAVGVVPVALGWLIGPNRPDSEKLSPYECGFEAFEDARMKFDVRYYLIAILFILFDLEIAFLFPWAIVLNEIGMFGFVSMLVFLGILVVGFVYEWMKGALEWTTLMSMPRGLLPRMPKAVRISGWPASRRSGHSRTCCEGGECIEHPP
jgi:NADH-quinone oxidoreductase subunit A